jgi:hypothetical protein
MRFATCLGCGHGKKRLSASLVEMEFSWPVDPSPQWGVLCRSHEISEALRAGAHLAPVDSAYVANYEGEKLGLADRTQ